MKTRLHISAWVLFLLLAIFPGKLSSQVPFTSGGAGAPAGNSGINNIGDNATGLGCGGGGGSWWGGTGGSGKYGGGGAGAGGYSSISPMNWAGGDGGQGVVVIAYYNGASFVSSVVLISGTSVTVGSGITSAKVWAIGGGGGGGGATENDGTAAGSGAAGENIKWYATETGGTALPSTDVLANGQYYASQTVNGIESTSRFDVTVTVDPTPCAPTATSPQTPGAGATVAQLTTLTGQNIRWYDVATGGTALPSTTLLQSGTHTYYATQTIDCTESASRLAVTVTVN
jgi:hypothetical protein